MAQQPKPVAQIPFYRGVGDEETVFKFAFENQLPLLLKGPTGCGKSRLVEAMAFKLDRPLIPLVCHEETSAVDLIGRHLIKGGNTVWLDGPVTRAVKEGAILYLDEIAEARPDILVVIHSLTDHRRQLYLDRKRKLLTAHPAFMLVASFNPGYQRGLKELKPSTRQRFVCLQMSYPRPDIESDIVATEAKVDHAISKKLVAVAGKIRQMTELNLSETVSTRLLVDAGVLIRAGLPARQACNLAVVQPLTDDVQTAAALNDLVCLIL